MLQKFWHVCHWRLDRAKDYFCRLLRHRQPSLHGRITKVFLISFVVFIAVAGSSLLLVFNYQLHSYTEFVGKQYAVQLAKVLEAYYNSQKSWWGIEKWLQQNFAPGIENSSTKHKVSGTPPESQIKSRRQIRGMPRYQKSRHSFYLENITVDIQNTADISTESIAENIAENIANGKWQEQFFSVPQKFAARQNLGSFLDIISLPVFFARDPLATIGRGRAAELFFSLNATTTELQQKWPHFYFHRDFFSATTAKNLAANTKFMGPKYLYSPLLSFCLAAPFCAGGGEAEQLVADKWFAEKLESTALISEHWSRQFFGPQYPDNDSLNEDTLQNFLQEKGLFSWVQREDRPELFIHESQYSNNLLNQLQLPYTTTGRNKQTFVLLDLHSQIITSNLPQNILIRELGATWEQLQKYIVKYKKKNISPQLNDTNTSPEILASKKLVRQDFRSLLNFGRSFTLLEHRNIFVINNADKQPVGFLYAESIVSPIWKNLNYEVNAVILKVALFSFLLIVLIYLIIDRFHLRRLFMPLKNLSDIAAEVRKGNTRARVQKIPKEEELALVTGQFNKMLDSLANEVMLREWQYRDIAHELRTPMTIISGELQLIQEGVYRADAEKIQCLSNQVQQMQCIVQGLEILYKVSGNHSQQEKFHFEIICAQQLLEEAFAAFQTQMKQKEIKFSLQVDFPQRVSNIFIKGDSHRLHQVFANCLVNAKRYTAASGQIELAGKYFCAGDTAQRAYYESHNLDIDKNYVLFSIADTGCGIVAEKRKLVFERFFRIDDDRCQKTGGCGLGLAISKSFIELHDGKIWVEESNLTASSGAKFCFALPCFSETS